MGESDVNVMTGTKVPALRFNGFDDEWVEKKLSEGMSKYTERVYIEDVREYGQVTIRNTGDVELRGYKLGSKIGRKRQAKVNLLDYPNTLLFTRQTIEQGGIGFSPVEVDGAIVTENMPTIDVDVNIYDRMFIDSFVRSAQWYKNVILANIQGGTAQVAIHERDVLKSSVIVPSIFEQQQIGQTFKTVDALIQSEEQKLEQLQSLKKSFLQKMFPKKGAMIPELRFDGFSGDWTEKKLGDVSTVQTGKLNANAMTEDGEYPFFTCAKETYVTDSYAFDDESLLIAGNGEIGLVKYYNGRFNAYQRTYVLTDIVENVKFLENVLNIYLPEQIQIMTFGSTMPYITMGTLTDLSVFIPSLEEQQAIGQFFKTFDELIAKQEEKVENGKLLKKALLQKMFV